MLHLSSSSQDTPSTDEYHDLLQHHFPHARYWLNLLLTHPFVHGPDGLPDISARSGIPPLPYLPLDPVLSQTSQIVQPYQSSAWMDGPVQPPSFGSASGNGQPDNGEDLNVQVTVSVLLDTGVVGGPISHVQLQFPVDTSSEDFFSCICAKMDLDPNKVELGYKYHADQACDPPHQLSNADQLLKHGQG
ncbi:hypothetical protein F5J12DRAFT_782255 [Pisolithus orientalis]|uniref:uncharacterized protein n=1 Tax=Pisolithus orientalis TaxID=936130 RepID=UPI0022256DC6|nr:uncharacterized protein F5J12DRAFT_782255 [Pisolithus orientalis]KAI6008824.1 hypothetical protein F5J12DRAFT_782255 [Pisolithus orientalis]